MERDNLAAHAERLGKIFQDYLRRLQTIYPCIGDVRGQGLLVGLEIVKDRKSKTPDEALGNALAERMLELGLSANVVRVPGFASCFRMAPSLTITEEELLEGCNIIEEAFRTTPGTTTTTTVNGTGK